MDNSCAVCGAPDAGKCGGHSFEEIKAAASRPNLTAPDPREVAREQSGRLMASRGGATSAALEYGEMCAREMALRVYAATKQYSSEGTLSDMRDWLDARIEALEGEK